MRRPLDLERLHQFMQDLGTLARGPARVYFTGGASALLIGWRRMTIDVDLKFVPDQDALLRALPEIKERLEINIELASPADFIPELPGWEGRSVFIRQEGDLAFHHYDFYSQALSKIERGHHKDVADLEQLMQRGLVQPLRLRELFDTIEPMIYRYPAIDPPTFRAAVETFLNRHQ